MVVQLSFLFIQVLVVMEQIQCNWKKFTKIKAFCLEKEKPLGFCGTVTGREIPLSLFVTRAISKTAAFTMKVCKTRFHDKFSVTLSLPLFIARSLFASFLCFLCIAGLSACMVSMAFVVLGLLVCAFVLWRFYCVCCRCSCWLIRWLPQPLP